MQKHRSRRKQIAIRSFTYGAMTLAVVVGVLFTLAWVSGFRFNLNSREISQVALLQFRSFPSGANVDIDGKKQTFSTPGRQNVKAGASDIRMYKNGYRDWAKPVNLRAGEIRWLDYARLIPQSVTTDSVQTFPALKEMLASPDAHWILMRTTDTAREFTLADISDPKNVRFSQLAIPGAALTPSGEGQTESFAIVEWDSGSRFALIKHVVGDKTEFVRIDRKNPGTAVNLTRDFNIAIAYPRFSGSSGNVFFALTGTDLRKIDYGNNSVSAPLVSDVTSYNLYGDNKLTYVAKTAKTPQQQIVGIYIDGKNTIVKTYNEIMPTFAEFTHYYDSDYLAIGRSETVSVIASPLSSDASNVSAVYLSSPGGMDFMMFNNSGRFVIAGKDTKLVSYDLETGEHYSFATGGFKGVPQWLDDYYLVDPSGNKVLFVEFDGMNRNEIVSGRGNVTLSGDGKYMFSLADGSAGAVLQRSKLVTD